MSVGSPVKSLMREGGGGEKEGGTLSDAGRQEGGRHARTRSVRANA